MASGYPKKKPTLEANYAGEGRWSETQIKNCATCNGSGAILDSSNIDYLRLVIDACQQLKMVLDSIWKPRPTAYFLTEDQGGRKVFAITHQLAALA